MDTLTFQDLLLAESVDFNWSQTFAILFPSDKSGQQKCLIELHLLLLIMKWQRGVVYQITGQLKAISFFTAGKVMFF